MKVDEDKVNEVHQKAIIIDGRDPTHLMFIFTREEKPDYYASIKEGGLTASLVDAAWLYDRFSDNPSTKLREVHELNRTNPLHYCQISSLRMNLCLLYLCSSVLS